MFLTAGRRVCPSAQTKLVSPSGRDVAQRQRGLIPADMAFQICPDTNLSACCSFRHGLRCATFLREEGFGFPRSPNLSLPPGEMLRSDREGWNGFPNTQKTAAAQTAAVFFPSLAYSESRFVMLSKLMPKVDRLCSIADVAGWSTPATPSRIKPRLKPMIKR